MQKGHIISELGHSFSAMANYKEWLKSLFFNTSRGKK